MAEYVEKPRLLFFVCLVALLMAGYIVLTVTGHENEARRIGELLSLVVVAIVSYYLGWGKRQYSSAISSKNYAQKFGHVTKQYLYNLAYFMWGVGVALFVQHIICSGFDFELTEILCGHEYIALYCIIAGIICYYWQKKLCVKLKISIT